MDDTANNERTYRESETKRRVSSVLVECSRRPSIISRNRMFARRSNSRGIDWVFFCLGKRGATGSIAEARVARSRIPREGQSLSLALTEASVSCYRRTSQLRTLQIVRPKIFSIPQAARRIFLTIGIPIRFLPINLRITAK